MKLNNATKSYKNKNNYVHERNNIGQINRMARLECYVKIKIIRAKTKDRLQIEANIEY